MRGVDIIVEISDPLLPETFITVAGQRNATLSESSDTVDITTKNSNGNYEYDYGLYGWTVSADGLYIVDDAGYAALRDAMKNKTKVKMQIKESGVASQSGEALITSRELEAPYDGEVTYSVEFQGTGALVVVV